MESCDSRINKQLQDTEYALDVMYRAWQIGLDYDDGDPRLDDIADALLNEEPRDPDYIELCDALFDDVQASLISYGLSFDYVEPDTFDNQPEGYWRWQLSWGGPSDEYRAYVNEGNRIYRLEYWFLDWFDGASRRIYPGNIAWDIIQDYFLDLF